MPFEAAAFRSPSKSERDDLDMISKLLNLLTSRWLLASFRTLTSTRGAPVSLPARLPTRQTADDLADRFLSFFHAA